MTLLKLAFEIIAYISLGFIAIGFLIELTIKITEAESLKHKRILNRHYKDQYWSANRCLSCGFSELSSDLRKGKVCEKCKCNVRSRIIKWHHKTELAEYIEDNNENLN